MKRKELVLSAWCLVLSAMLCAVGLSATAKELGGVQLWKGGPVFKECNVGAKAPQEPGLYYWWGDTGGYVRNSSNDGWMSANDDSPFQFTEANCPTFGKGKSELKTMGYIDDESNPVLNALHDAARAKDGAPWRMMTKAEMDQLVSTGYCERTWTTDWEGTGKAGYVVKGKGAYAAKSIFLPAAGYGEDDNLESSAEGGYYWSSTPDLNDLANYLYLGKNIFAAGGRDRYHGCVVRAVRDIVEYLDWDDVENKMTHAVCDVFEVVTNEMAVFEAGKTYAVKDNVETSAITVEGTPSNPARLILCDGAELVAKKGIDVGEGKALVIYGQEGGTGALVATGGTSGHAGIGGGWSKGAYLHAATWAEYTDKLVEPPAPEPWVPGHTVDSNQVGVCSWTWHGDMETVLKEMKADGCYNGMQLALAPWLGIDSMSLYFGGKESSEMWDFIKAKIASGELNVMATMINFPKEDYTTLVSITNTQGYMYGVAEKKEEEAAKQWASNLYFTAEAARLSKELGVRTLTTEAGFICIDEPLMFDRMKELCLTCAVNGVQLLIESGPQNSLYLTNLLVNLEKEGFTNVGINFDPGDTELFGSENPVDSFKIMKPWIRMVHVKDCKENDRSKKGWNEDCVWGDGVVSQMDFHDNKDEPRHFLEQLTAEGYAGDILYERLSGDETLTPVRKEEITQAMDRIFAALPEPIGAESDEFTVDLRTRVEFEEGKTRIDVVTWSATAWGAVPGSQYTDLGFTNKTTGATGVIAEGLVGENLDDCPLPEKDGEYLLTHSTGDLTSFVTFTVSGYPLGCKTNPWTVGPEDDPEGTVAWKDENQPGVVYFKPPRSAVSRTGLETLTNALAIAAQQSAEMPVTINVSGTIAFPPSGVAKISGDSSKAPVTLAGSGTIIGDVIDGGNLLVGGSIKVSVLLEDGKVIGVDPAHPLQSGAKISVVVVHATYADQIEQQAEKDKPYVTYGSLAEAIEDGAVDVVAAFAKKADEGEKAVPPAEVEEIVKTVPDPADPEKEIELTAAYANNPNDVTNPIGLVSEIENLPLIVDNTGLNIVIVVTATNKEDVATQVVTEMDEAMTADCEVKKAEIAPDVATLGFDSSYLDMSAFFSFKAEKGQLIEFTKSIIAHIPMKLYDGQIYSVSRRHEYEGKPLEAEVLPMWYEGIDDDEDVAATNEWVKVDVANQELVVKTRRFCDYALGTLELEKTCTIIVGDSDKVLGDEDPVSLATNFQIRVTGEVNASDFAGYAKRAKGEAAGDYAINFVCTRMPQGYVGEFVENPGTFTILPPSEFPEAMGKVTYAKAKKGIFLQPAKNATWKAKASTGCVFTGWSWVGEAGEPAGFAAKSENERRDPKLTFKVGKDELVRPTDVAANWAWICEDTIEGVELTSSNLVVETLSRVTASVKGLPKGMKFSAKTLKITGTPTKAGLYTVKVTVRNVCGSTDVIRIPVTVVALPKWALGNFDGYHMEAGETNGTFTATVGKTGKVSGRTKGGFASTSFSAKSFADVFFAPDGSNLVYAVDVTVSYKVGKKTVKETDTLYLMEDEETGLGMIGGGDADGNGAVGVQRAWSRKDLALVYPAFRTKPAVTLKLDSGITLKFGATGKVTIAGKVAGDNGNSVKVSGSTRVLPSAWPSEETLRAQVYVYVAPKKNLVDGVSEVYEVYLTIDDASGKFAAVSFNPPES